MRKKIILLVFAIVVIALHSTAQVGATYVNRVFQDGSGSPTFNPLLSPLGLPWSKSIYTASGDLVTVGHTFGASSEDVYLTRYDSDGTLIFQNNYDINSAGYHDYGTDVSEALNGDLLICGTTDNGSPANYDVVVLRVSASGVLLYTATRDGAFGKNDFAVSVLEDAPSGAVFVGANTEAIFGTIDYWVLKFSNVLSYQADAAYDYTGLSDVAIGMELTTGTEVRLIGASASGTNSCDYAVASWNLSNLTYITDARSSLPGVALDKALAYCRDAGNNTYITGQAWNGTDFDIKTLKIAANMTVAWTATLDVHGQDDVAGTLALDPVNGDVIVGGYATKSNSTKEMICLRYNAATGATLSLHTQSSEDQSSDAFIKKICTNAQGDVYFIGGERGLSGNKQVVTGKIRANGMASWQKKITDTADDILPSDIKTSNNEIYVISVLDSLTDSYLTTEYTEFEMDTTVTYTGGTASCKKRELIVRFMPSALDSAFIDNTIGTKVSTFGNLHDFMKPTAYSQVASALSEACPECDIKAVKVFPGLSTTYTSSISRLGEVVPIPDFWTTLLLEFPTSLSIQQAHAILNTLPNVVAYSHPNFIALSPPAFANTLSIVSGGMDPYYPHQTSLHPSSLYMNAHIDMENAWKIFPDAGYPFIKTGVFDTGLDWKHLDFGYTSANPNTSKVNGWDFQTTQNLRYVPDGGDYYAHGTGVAGIIGAIRNNTLAIKGIAGGNDTLLPSPNTGVSLYGLKILNNQPFASTLNYIADAIVSTALDNPNASYEYGLYLQNHSWVMPQNLLPWYVDTNIVLLSEAVHQANRMNVTFVAARGNDGMNHINYPGVTDDDWVLLVGGLAQTGNWADSAQTGNYYQASWGRGVDIAAPSYADNILSICTASFSSTGITGFGMTSAAAPHVSGVAALLMSYLNDTLVQYNNLAPEDCEQIIQRSAGSMPNGASLPNDFVGYGRLNAGKALRLVEKPCNNLRHFGTKYFPHTLSKNQVGSNDTIVMTERSHDLNSPFNYLSKGKYVVNTWQIDAVVTHGLPNTDTITAYWPRPSGSDVWEKVKNKKLVPRERDTILSCTNTQAHLRGYIYKISDTLGSIIGWWPCDTSFSCPKTNSLFEYSILTKSCSISVTSIKEETLSREQNVKIFPNPAHNSQTIVIDTDKICKLTIDAYDVMGKLVKNVFNGKTSLGKTTINNDVSSLAKSLYIYVIKIDDEVIQKKFIRE